MSRDMTKIQLNKSDDPILFFQFFTCLALLQPQSIQSMKAMKARCHKKMIKLPVTSKWNSILSILYFMHSHNWNEPRHDKTNKMSLRLAKTQIGLGIHPVWSESSLCAQWVAKDSSFLHTDSEDSDQPGRIWVFAGRTLILLVLSCRGSIIIDYVNITNVKNDIAFFTLYRSF